ncbi:putative quinol monooxygenase [Arenibacter sp. M-2]|uniref:putative quinol monooxygenase n=1 Tax=unclassified Arenibacter TaxID=2615047 RepID=UPI000D756A5A|nr:MULTISPECIES: putative quinol monooxygenase [unclassified Arenibacter]MDL5512947.1 putative quinol monooxygenase [Arenibacter sp. M-2]PXX31506.1 quinol monooxygenase YgiN [Arenibacter sp. ARW7G5Y1]|tara:strand:+ start:17543 stop:17839 length:297 start_codon:yes stop_codon:yes gene_type:complete
MSNKQLTITASILAKPDKREFVKQALLKLIPPTLKEDGCLNYDLHQDNENPDRFFFYENWASRELWLNHNASEHIAAHRKATEGTIVEVIINELSPVG